MSRSIVSELKQSENKVDFTAQIPTHATSGIILCTKKRFWGETIVNCAGTKPGEDSLPAQCIELVPL